MCDDVNADCQSLIAKDPICHGWIHVQRGIHKLAQSSIKSFDKITKTLAKNISWDLRYFILCGQIIFIFKNDTSKRAARVLRLVDFSSVNEIKLEDCEIPWPIEMKQKFIIKSFIFAPMSEKERNKWITCLRGELSLQPSNIEAGQTTRPLPSIPFQRKSSSNKGEKNKIKVKVINDENDTDSSDDSSNCDYEIPTEDYIDNVKSPETEKTKLTIKNQIPNIKNDITKQIESRIQLNRKSLSQTPNPPENIIKPKSNTLTKKTSGLLISNPPEISLTKPILTKKQGESLIPKSNPSEIPVMKNKFDDITKKSTNFNEQEAKKLLIMKINPMIRVEETNLSDDGIYEIEYVRNQNSNIGFWKGTVEQASEMIKKMIDKNGTFLIRDSKEADGFTLSVIDNGVIRKFPIQKESNNFTLGGNTFTNLEQLVNFHKRNCLPGKDFKLSEPYSHYLKN